LCECPFEPTGRHWFDLYESKLNNDCIVKAIAPREIIFVREGLFRFLNSSCFSTHDAEACIHLLACLLASCLRLLASIFYVCVCVRACVK